MRMAVGAGILAWAGAGLYLSDRAEEKWYAPSEEDRAELRRVTPRVVAVDRKEER